MLIPSVLSLTLPQAVEHLRELHNDVSADTVEGAMLEWLETNAVPDNVTQEQMDAHDEIDEPWIADYWQKQNQVLDNS